jgi:WASH complex subunit 7
MNYEYDPFDDGSNSILKERHLERSKEFIKKYAQDLHVIEQTIDESLSKVWDFDTDPIELDIKPYEQTSIIELAKTDNKLFSKIIIVFSSLCQEIKKLKSIVKKNFYFINFI